MAYCVDVTYVLVLVSLLASFGAVTPDKLTCVSGGGAPKGSLMIRVSPERTYITSL